MVVTDPFPDSIGLVLGNPEAGIVTVSNPHPNHSCVEAVAGEPTVLDTPGEYEVRGVYCRGLPTPRARGEAPRKRNVAYLIDMDGVSVLHLGDITAPLTASQIEELQPVDVLFVPAGGTCTMDQPHAVELVKRLTPRVVIPMHYAVPGLNVELESPAEFLRALGVEEPSPQQRLVLNRTNLPDPITVVVMKPLGAR